MAGEIGSSTSRCAVCRWPITVGRQCGTCGWNRDSTDARAVLTAQFHWDREAARRAAGSDQRQLDELRQYLRGYRPDEPVPADDLAEEEPAEPAWPGLVIDKLTGAATVFGIGPNGVEMIEMALDRSGQLGVADRQQWPWAKLLPSLAHDPTRLRFHLAGGIGTTDVDPVDLSEEARSNLPLTALAGGSTLLVLPEPGWALTARTVEWLRARNPAAVVWRGVHAEESVRRLMRLRPLDHPYHLVLSVVDAEGAIRLHPVLLFPAGTIPIAVATVEIQVPPGVRGPVSLPVMICQDGHGKPLRHPRDWLPVRIGSAELPPGTRALLRLRLTGSGMVTFDGVDDVDDDPRRWSDLLDTVATAMPLTDLVLAIDYSGAEASSRIIRAREILAEVAASLPVAETVRVVLVGYGQHGARRDGGEPPLRLTAFSGAGAASAELEFWTAEPNRDDSAAAVEDALAAITGIRWRPGARRIAVLIGSKPPYPTGQDPFDPAAPCPRRLNWRDYADQLRDDQVTLVVSHQPPDWRQRGRIREALARRAEAWQNLGSGGVYGHDVPPRVFVRSARLLDDELTPPPPPLARPGPGGAAT